MMLTVNLPRADVGRRQGDSNLSRYLRDTSPIDSLSVVELARFGPCSHGAHATLSSVLTWPVTQDFGDAF